MPVTRWTRSVRADIWDHLINNVWGIDGDSDLRQIFAKGYDAFSILQISKEDIEALEFTEKGSSRNTQTYKITKADEFEVKSLQAYFLFLDSKGRHPKSDLDWQVFIYIVPIILYGMLFTFIHLLVGQEAPRLH